MKCPYCGSLELVWDDKSGDVVCANCGSVIDKVYYLGGLFYNDDETIPITVGLNVPTSVKKYKEQLRLIKRKRKREMVIYNGSFIKESNLNVMKLIENNERLLIIYDIIDSLTVFKTRNPKYKLAIGIYLYNRSEFEKLKKSLNISERYMKKILAKLKAKEKAKLESSLRKRFKQSSLSSQRPLFSNLEQRQ